jgi:succinate dehydrogenase flavin-adding protein (antitoxin of CptAB toxin-antitoxin module)
MQSDITSLIEIFLKPGEDHPVLHDFPEQLADEHQQYYKHVLVDEDNVLWYWFMSTKPIEDELDAPLLLYRLAAIDLDDQKAVDFVLTTHPIESRKLIEGTTAPSIGFDELLKCSGGYILYKWQAEFIYRTYTLCNAEEAAQWVKDWNKKKTAARTTDFEIAGHSPLLYVLQAGCYDRNNAFLYSAPKHVSASLKN